MSAARGRGRLAAGAGVRGGGGREACGPCPEPRRCMSDCRAVYGGQGRAMGGREGAAGCRWGGMPAQQLSPRATAAAQHSRAGAAAKDHDPAASMGALSRMHSMRPGRSSTMCPTPHLAAATALLILSATALPARPSKASPAVRSMLILRSGETAIFESAGQVPADRCWPTTPPASGTQLLCRNTGGRIFCGI